jgi:hypothetical protein
MHTLLRLPSLSRLRDLTRDPLAAWRDRYRPECHYMRGPGPACRRAALARQG